MKARLLGALTGALLILAMPAAAHATMVAGRFVAVDDPGYQYHPAMSGDVVVYQQKDPGGDDWDIWARDLSADTTFPICTAEGDQVLPDISGSLVVWEDHRAGKLDIYSYDLITHTEAAVCTDTAAQRHPRVDGGWIVWQDRRDKDWDIYGWTAAAPANGVPICAAGGDQIEPDVSGDVVVWTDKRVPDDPDIRGYNRVADYIFQVCVDYAAQDQPAVAAQYVVWRDARNVQEGEGTGTDIYGFDMRSSTEFVVTTAPGNQKEPAISSDLVAYTDGSAVDQQGLDVWVHDITFDQEIPVTTAPAWQGQPCVDGGTVLWGDARLSKFADLRGAVLSPWFARVRFKDSALWTDTRTVRLLPYGRSKGGIVTQMLPANAPQAGAWEPYSPVRDAWSLSSGDGLKKVTMQFADLSGGLSPVVSATITLDTHGPVCSVPKAVTVVQGDTAQISYRVNDNLAKTANVVLRVKNRAGAVLKAVILRGRPTGTLLTQGFVCNLEPGTYRIVVEATDLAGNQQATRGTNTLTVTQ